VLVRISGEEKNYAWGSKTLIPDYFGLDVSSEKIAEVWFGTHPAGESKTIAVDESLLSEKISRPLGFLAKFLAAEKALSIQVHPNPEQAKAGFEAENALGIQLDDPKRNYKDSSHKPEILIALTVFRALCGFRPQSELLVILSDIGQSIPEFKTLETALKANRDLKEVFSKLLANQELANSFLDSIDSSKLGEISFRAYLLAMELSKSYRSDTGLLVSLMLNEVNLEPGEAIFLPAGNLHAYISGLGVEVMAASDNVLRGGLTEKHIDIEGLVEITDFNELVAPKVSPKKLAEGLLEYEVSVSDFKVYRAEVSSRNLLADLDMPADAIILCTEGSVAVSSSLEEREVLLKSEAVFVSGAKKISLSGSGVVFIVLGS
jgi:mannose-6-phosphate isomerase